MEPMMVRAILGPDAGAAPEALRDRATAEVRAFIDRTTGVQTLTQMQGLAGLVREFGRVPAAEILDARGYKALYLRELNKRVRARLRRLERGERAPDDFIIPHARALLDRLRAAGIRHYLASGTDTADVAAEARALGYAPLFDGGIHGATDDPVLDPKRVVLDRLLREPGLAPGAFAVFGDGPVEMREAGRRGGFRIGVASDEINRGHLNPAKRARLIRAGADVIVPDYAELPRLLALLGLAE
jgi:phosphoglycolate phosphatase-like HAD superfamily hydrolase